MQAGGRVLSPSEVAFYAAIATVIPVLLLGYLVGLGQVARGVVGMLEDAVIAADRKIEEIEHDPEFGGEPMITLLPGIRAALMDVFVKGVRRIVIFPLVILLVGLPIAGEVMALMALESNAASSLTRLFVWLGLGTGILVLTAPLAWTMSVRVSRCSAAPTSLTTGALAELASTSRPASPVSGAGKPSPNFQKGPLVSRPSREMIPPQRLVRSRPAASSDG